MQGMAGRTVWAKLGLAGALACVYASPSRAASCNNAISITEVTQMNFGKIGAVPAGGTVILTSSGSVSGPAGFFLSGSPAAGSFNITGSKNCSLVISYTAGSLTGPGAAMTLNSFTDNSGTSPKFNSQGAFTFSVGANLAVNGNQAGGNYTGTYTVTVIY